MEKVVLRPKPKPVEQICGFKMKDLTPEHVDECLAWVSEELRSGRLTSLAILSSGDTHEIRINDEWVKPNDVIVWDRTKYVVITEAKIREDYNIITEQESEA